MKTGFYLPENPLARYRELYAALNARRRWWRGAIPLRYAALTLATTRGDAVAITDKLMGIADVLKRRAGWFGALQSEVRFVVAAMILRNWDEPDSFMDEVDRARELFRREGLRRGGIREIMAILLLRQNREGRPIPREDVARFRSMYEEMRHHHWWLTGIDDYPSCAVLSLQRGRVEEISARVERFYHLLRKAGCSRGNDLQRVSHILYLNRAVEEKVVRRFVDFREGFRRARVRIYVCDWDELAILTFLSQPTGLIVKETVKARDAMLELRPGVGRWVAFNLGASIAFLKLARLSGQTETLLDAKALSDLQAIIDAQQAAAAGAAAAASTSAASS